MTLLDMQSTPGPMRMAYCYQCNTLTKLEWYEGPPDYDVFLQHWIDDHLHGKTPDDARGMIFRKDPSQFDHSGAGSNVEEKMVEEVRAELAVANLEVYALRDSLKEDAVKCHRRHGQPSWPGKLCGSYRNDDKRVGRTKNVPKDYQRHLCDFCPYEETVRVQKRWDAGQYK
jgi:hypothetical protein